ncbi:hypothetical protein IEQ34_015613 [Dendrobium chrysotoxum]|uniref:Uncharacterized protein n=1 Tax=Dendrobium chrysotoxum TaxID=161865 RepID=A0AAV7GGD4_DENCH|nr:hypothetical protein IEQ34_015613 [Dendrobium chrysotoxum]
MENRFGGLEEMMRKLLEMQSKTPPTVPMANPNQELIRIPLVESKRKEIRWEGVRRGEFLSSKATSWGSDKGGSRFLDEGTIRRKFFGGGGRVADHYGRHFRQGEWAISEGRGQEPHSRALIMGRTGFSDGGIVGRECMVEVVGWPTTMGDLLGKRSGRLEDGDKPSHGDRVMLGRWKKGGISNLDTWGKYGGL